MRIKPEVSEDLIMKLFYAVMIIFILPISVTSVHSVAERQFAENIEAIEYFEEVFDTAAAHAVAKVEDIDESDRRWDSGVTRNGNQRDTLQTGWNDDFRLSRNPSESRTIFRNENENLRLNFRGNGRQRLRNQNRYSDSQNSARYYPQENDGRNMFGLNSGNSNFRGDRFNRPLDVNEKNLGNF